MLFRSQGAAFAFIATQRTHVSVASFCRRYHVTTAGFYAGCRRGARAHAEQDRTRLPEIERLFLAHEERYGSPRRYRLLVSSGWTVSRRRVARLMRTAGRRAKAVRGDRATGQVHQLDARHPNRLWTTTVTRPNQGWVGDLTYRTVAGTWRDLAIVVRDQYSRRILAWSLTRRRTSAVTGAVLALATRRRPPGGVIVPSDRGSAYMGASFCARVQQYGMLQRANGSGPGDKAHAESFFHTLKAELTRGVTFGTEPALRRELQRDIRYDNTVRLHSGLHDRSPLACERHAA